MDNTQIKAFGTEGQELPLHEMKIARRALRDNDVAMEILYCGICHSDLHTIKNDWGDAVYPVVPGHEIIGRITRVGQQVKSFKVGDLAGIGCIADSCGECDECHEHQEQLCNSCTMSFNGVDLISGGRTYGGFSKEYVCEERYVLHIPPFAELAKAAPLLCAGITVYSPLKLYQVAPGKKVGIVGIGGLGHLAIRIAKAMGGEVTVFTTHAAKADDAYQLGADHVVVSTDKAAMKGAPKQDIILDTVSALHNINSYLSKLKTDGSLIVVGLPPEPFQVGSFNLIKGRKRLTGSFIGGIAETQEVIDFCYKHSIVAESEIISIDQVNDAFKRLEKGDVKYRFVVDMSTL